MDNSVAEDAGIDGARIAVLIPCFNEEKTIGNVVRDFRVALPGAAIFVYDNNSTDRTADVADAAGAIVRHESMQGKGYVVRRMFSDIDADAYVMLDGDDTYDAFAAPAMVERVLSGGVDMAVGRRVDSEAAAYRNGHRFGNTLLTGTVSMLFGDRVQDMLSGYRVFSRRFVKSFAVFTPGFEIETEMTVHALGLRLPVEEIPTAYKSRPEGSASKLRTYKDGSRIIFAIFNLLRGERPLLFFTLVAAVLECISVVLAYPILVEYLRTGLVPRFPTAILSTGLSILSALSLACAFTLDTVTRGRKALTMLTYLSVPRWSLPEGVRLMRSQTGRLQRSRISASGD
jgi:glycosyltransferase involved in cell wall biosynthesis